MKKVGLATYKGCLQLTEDDQLLIPPLRDRGIETQALAWDDATVDWLGFDQVIIRSCWDYHLRLPEFLAWLSRLEACDIEMQNSAQLVRWNADKRYLRQLEAKGIRVPDTIWLEEGDERRAGDILRAQGWECAVVKPTISATAYRTHCVSRRQADQIVRGPFMVQEFLPEITRHGEWSLIFIGGEYSHAVRKFPAAEDFRVQEEFGGRVESAIPNAQLVDLASNVVNNLGAPVLYARLDGVERSGEFLLMELELIEPVLFLGLGAAAKRLAHAIAEAVERDAKTRAMAQD